MRVPAPLSVNSSLCKLSAEMTATDEERGRWSRSSLNSRNLSLVPYLTHGSFMSWSYSYEIQQLAYTGYVMANKTYLIQIYDIQLLASDAVKQATLLIQEDYLHRLELFGK